MDVNTTPENEPHVAPLAVVVLRLPEDVAKWTLVQRFLKLRKSVFIDRMGWKLHASEAMEYEQYDTPRAVYLVAHRDGEVVGGARLLPTDHRVGTGRVVYTYMIRDAWLENLPGLPADLCEAEPPVDSAIWELTRLTAPAEPGIGAAILTAVNEFLRREGARACLFLGPPAFMRMARSMGYEPKPLGKITGNHDGRFLAFSCAVI